MALACITGYYAYMSKNSVRYINVSFFDVYGGQGVTHRYYEGDPVYAWYAQWRDGNQRYLEAAAYVGAIFGTQVPTGVALNYVPECHSSEGGACWYAPAPWSAAVHDTTGAPNWYWGWWDRVMAWTMCQPQAAPAAVTA